MLLAAAVAVDSGLKVFGKPKGSRKLASHPETVFTHAFDSDSVNCLLVNLLRSDSKKRRSLFSTYNRLVESSAQGLYSGKLVQGRDFSYRTLSSTLNDSG